jgi:hypothetical protein
MSLNSSIGGNKERYSKDKVNPYDEVYSNNYKQPLSERDVAIKQWLTERLKEKLRRASILSLHHHKPLVIYRKTIEEEGAAVEEEISYVTGNHIVYMTYAYGGFIPTSFQTIEVYTLDKFARWLLQIKNKDLLLQYFETLEQL